LISLPGGKTGLMTCAAVLTTFRQSAWQTDKRFQSICLSV